MAKKADLGEALGDEPVERLEATVRAALRRKPTQEERLAGALRALAPFSSRVRHLVEETADTLIKRGSFQRPLYSATIRTIAELESKASTTLLSRAMSAEEAGGLATLSAACFVQDNGLGPALARVAASRHPHLAFAAEIARVARGESGEQHVASVAPKIKESHRIALCVEIFVPLLHHRPLPVSVAPALAVLRDAERHLGRWLVFGEIAARSGDPGPLAEAESRAVSGPSSARAAWAFVAWALRRNGSAPTARPTVELVSRLSDRPSADRDPTFLYRLAEARISTARPMLENLARGGGLKSEAGVRAAMYLARDHGREDLKRALEEVTRSPRHEALRGVAAAALRELDGDAAVASAIDELVSSRQLPTMAWGGLLRAAAAAKISRVLSEQTFRRVQLGWVE